MKDGKLYRIVLCIRPIRCTLVRRYIKVHESVSLSTFICQSPVSVISHRLFKGKHQVEYFRLTDFSPPVLSLKFIAFVYLTEANKTEQAVEYSIFIPMSNIQHWESLAILISIESRVAPIHAIVMQKP